MTTKYTPEAFCMTHCAPFGTVHEPVPSSAGGLGTTHPFSRTPSCFTPHRLGPLRPCPPINMAQQSRHFTSNYS